MGKALTRPDGLLINGSPSKTSFTGSEGSEFNVIMADNDIGMCFET